MQVCVICLRFPRNLGYDIRRALLVNFHKQKVKDESSLLTHRELWSLQIGTLISKHLLDIH